MGLRKKSSNQETSQPKSGLRTSMPQEEMWHGLASRDPESVARHGTDYQASRGGHYKPGQ